MEYLSKEEEIFLASINAEEFERTFMEIKAWSTVKKELQAWNYMEQIKVKGPIKVLAKEMKYMPQPIGI